MMIGNEFTDLAGATWRRAGYSNPPRKEGGVYRFIRMSDGARVRLKSTKFYRLQINAQTLAEISQLPSGTDQTINGHGAAKLADDWRKVGFMD